MHKRTYKIVDLPGLSGLYVVGVDNSPELVEVLELINMNVTLGDRLLRYKLPEDSLYINVVHLEEVDDDTNIEFAVDNPYGEYMFEGRFQKGDLQIVHAVYRNAVTVTIVEKNPPKMKGMDKTLFTGNFFNAHRNEALKLIEDLLHGQIDPDDIIFAFKNLQEE